MSTSVAVAAVTALLAYSAGRAICNLANGLWRICDPTSHCAPLTSTASNISASQSELNFVRFDAVDNPVSKRLGSPYRSGRVDHWLKIKNPAAPAVKREAEEDWRR
jgi:hypothetical protein